MHAPPRNGTGRVSPPPGTEPPTSQQRSCPHSTSCPLYPQFTMESFLRYWRTSYCDADYARCARYRLSAEGKPVPLNMLPSGNLMKVPK